MSSPEIYDNWGREMTNNNPWGVWGTSKELQKSPEEIDQTMLGYFNYLRRTDPEAAKKAHIPHVVFNNETKSWVIVPEKASVIAPEIAPVPKQIPVQVIHVAEVAIPVVVEPPPLIDRSSAPIHYDLAA